MKKINQGSKISLVVSALLLGGNLYGATLSTATTTMQEFTNVDATLNVTATGSIQVTDDQFGVNLDSVGISSNLTLANSGTISVVKDNINWVVGTRADTNGNVSISNSGTISTTSNDWAGGVTVYNAQNSSIVNTGTISAASTNSQAYGIGMWNISDTISVSNGGSIQVSAMNDSVYGIDVSDMFFNSTISNSGSIQASVEGASAFGIRIDDMYYNSSIKNSGTISVSADSYAYGIKANSIYDDSSIQNSGTISVSTTNSNVYGISLSYLYDNASIDNSGSISVSTEDGYAYGIGIFSDNNGDDVSIYNSGTILANGTIKSYGMFLYYTVGATNEGTITALINGVADHNAYTINSVSDAIITNTSSGKLYGNLKVDGTMNNAGLISLPYNATAEIYTLNNLATGTLELTLKAEDGVVTNSKAFIGEAHFDEGSTVAINILNSSTGLKDLVGQTLAEVITSSNDFPIDVDTLNLTDNSALLAFKAVQRNGGFFSYVDTEITALSIYESSQAGGGATPEAAKALDRINSENNPDMDTFLENFYTLPTHEDVAKAVTSTTPIVVNASTKTSSEVSKSVQGIVQMRQNANTGGGKNSGDALFAEKNLWIKPFGSIGSQDDKDGMNGFEVKAAGVGFGFDGEYMKNQKIGLALFYTKANVDVNNMDQTSDLGVFSTLVYGNVPILDDKTNFLYQLGYAWQNTDSERYIALAQQTADATYTTNTASIDLKVMRDVAINERLLLQPIVETTYRNFRSPDYTETGAGALNIISDAFSSDEFIVGGGVLAHYKLDNVSKIIGNINAGYDLNDKQQTVTSAYAGASGVKFETNGIDNGRWNYDLGLGYERDITTGNSINFMYNYQGQGATFENHVLSAKYVLTF